MSDEDAAATGDELADDQSADDELKRRYREALERKKAQTHATGTGPPTGHGVGPGGSAARRREFRRKSG